MFIYNQAEMVIKDKLKKWQQKIRSTVNLARSSSISFFWRFNKAASVIIWSVNKEEKHHTTSGQSITTDNKTQQIEKYNKMLYDSMIPK